MKTKMFRKPIFFSLLVVLLFIIAPVAMAQDTVTLTLLVDDGEINLTPNQALVDAYIAQNPNETIIIETRPGGADGDNIVKTRLATEDMTDIFFYNSGSLLQALNPAQTLVDLSDQPFVDNIVESFIPTVSQGDAIYGVPTGTGMGGGILYNTAVYDALGLEVPTTWDEFVANNEVIAEAGIAPVLATFGDTWTSQLFVLADYYNVEQGDPGFAERYTNNEAKYADTPAALAGFEHMEQAYELGWFQEDYATEPFEAGLALLANGEVAHFAMLTFAIGTIETNFPDQADDIGFFAQPGNDPEANGVTIWMPQATYIPQTTEGANLEAALDYLAFIASVEGTEALTSAVAPQGPYLIEGATLPDTVHPAVQDLAAYIEAGKSFPALEFLSPIKGPNLEQLLVSIGTGQMSALEAAEAYDFDVERQAQQLGLPGW
jgi:raffinose/stachyose/melibiose transport system substrate-binding protein